MGAGQGLPDCRDHSDDGLSCFRQTDGPLELNGQQLPTLEVRRNDWTRIIEVVREKRDKPRLPPSECLAEYNVCPMFLAEPWILEIFKLYFAIGGTSRIATPADYYALPAVYADAAEIITEELRKIRKARKGLEDGDPKR